MARRLSDAEASARLEGLDPDRAIRHDRADVAAIAAAVAARDEADAAVLVAVREARARRVPWVLIAGALGVTHQAARQRYKPLTEPVPAAAPDAQP